jgi:mannosyltransferase OCH1-like enzyme
MQKKVRVRFFFFLAGIVAHALQAATSTDFSPEVIQLYQNNLPLIYIDFDESMKTDEFQWIVDRALNKEQTGFVGCELMQFFRSLYAHYNYRVIQPDKKVRIPQIIHQIWIGDEVPVELKGFQESWKYYHPHWQYRLWTLADIPAMTLHNRELIEGATNPAEISDLLRYEILYQYGGVYIDMDFECLQPLDMLHYMYDFYIGIQPLDSGLVQLNNAIIGSKPGHPLLYEVIMSLEKNYIDTLSMGNIPARSGPVYMTKMFKRMAGTCGTRDIALPAHYFYPLGCMKTVCMSDLWRQQGSFGIHHWAKTWNKPEQRRSKFRSIKSWGTLC